MSPHQLTQFDYELPDITDFISGDTRRLTFTVVDESGNPVDISNATVGWELYNREYADDPADAVLTGADPAVELVTDNRVDTTQGAWEVRLDGAATADEWGSFTQRPFVEQPDGSTATWLGTIAVTA